MKKHLALLCCGVLAALALTGCTHSDVYETANFRFTAPSVWNLTDAEYDEASKENDMLKFAAYGGNFSVTETVYAQPLSYYSLDAETDGFKELTGYKYSAWETVSDYEYPLGTINRKFTINIYTDGHGLDISGSMPTERDLHDFEFSLTTLLETVEMTGEPIAPPTAEPGEADTSALHVTWSADWEKKIILRDHPEQELWLVLSSPDYKTDETTSFIVRDEGDTASAQESIDNLLAADGSESEYATNTVVRMDDKTLCGITFGDALRMVHTFKSDGSETVYRYYFLTVGDRVYSVMLMCDSKGEDNMNKLLRGITLTAK